MAAIGLRDVLRDLGTGQPGELVEAWDAVIEERCGTYVDDTLAFDHHRLAEMRAAAEHRPYATEDPAWRLAEALRRAARRGPDLLRAYLGVTQVLWRGRDALAGPGVAERAVALAEGDTLPARRGTSSWPWPSGASGHTAGRAGPAPRARGGRRAGANVPTPQRRRRLR
jgi:hypothetical protein